MAQVIIFTNENGGVSVCVPTGELDINAVKAKDTPSHSIIVQDYELPNADNDFFDAWELNDGEVTVNLTKAKAITKTRLRREREPLLAAQDVLFQRAQETGGENVDEPILKTVQKLTGKLTQKMRDGDQELQSKDYKYVVNSILSAIDMTKITEEDMNDMLNKLQNKDSEDTTEAEPSSGEEIPPAEEPVQETQMPWESKRVTKSVIDEFIKNKK